MFVFNEVKGLDEILSIQTQTEYGYMCISCSRSYYRWFDRHHDHSIHNQGRASHTSKSAPKIFPNMLNYYLKRYYTIIK